MTRDTFVKDMTASIAAMANEVPSSSPIAEVGARAAALFGCEPRPGVMEPADGPEDHSGKRARRAEILTPASG